MLLLFRFKFVFDTLLQLINRLFGDSIFARGRGPCSGRAGAAFGHRFRPSADLGSAHGECLQRNSKTRSPAFSRPREARDNFMKGKLRGNWGEGHS